jgi:pimeloyl-ACP methyl ester carboxylesterase
MRMAAAQPERFGKLVLAASVSGERVPSLPRIPIWRWFLPFWSRVIALNAWRKMFYDRSQVDTGAIRSAYLATARIQGSLDTVWAMWRDLRRDKKIAYGRIRQPVLVLWAEKEQIVPFAGRTLRKLREALPQAEVVIVPRTGHLLLEENPQAANEALRRFLAGRPQEQVAEAVKTA